MVDEKKHEIAFERAARAVHENYYGAGSWKKAGQPERSHARQTIRLALSAFAKNGLDLTEGSAPPRSAAEASAKPSGARAPVPRRF